MGKEKRRRTSFPGGLLQPLQRPGLYRPFGLPQNLQQATRWVRFFSPSVLIPARVGGRKEGVYEVRAVLWSSWGGLMAWSEVLVTQEVRVGSPVVVLLCLPRV